MGLERDAGVRSIAPMTTTHAVPQGPHITVHTGARRSTWATVAMCLALAPACKDKEIDASDDDKPAANEPCEPVAAGDPSPCADGLLCEPSDTAEGGYACATAIELHGQVIDGVTKAAIADAVVAALDETGAPLGDAARTDADGHYVLQVSARRDADGNLADDVRWTLLAAAQDYAIFPGGLRTALPVDTTAPTTEKDDDDHDRLVVDNATTIVALLPLPEGSGVTLSGRVDAEVPGGTLVVAEGGPAPAPYGIADASGAWVIFNVPPSSTMLRGYRRGLQVTPASIAGPASDVVLGVEIEDPAALAAVSGSINIVNAPGGSTSSVVLVPTSVYDPLLERGAVPFGLRAPDPGLDPNVAGSFTIVGVPAGDYQVLAAFENDDLVRDPDSGIAGTELQHVAVPDTQAVTLAESFKVTEALAVLGPGAETAEAVTTPPTLRWADDSSEDRYELRVVDAFGTLVWEVLDVPGVSGSDAVEVPYAGPALTPGMYYQFRATSIRETPNKSSPISRTEDLRGVFVFAP